MPIRAVLIADVSGSTPLYERHGTEHAVEEIGQCLRALQEIVQICGGEYVSSKGDDILALFEAADSAFQAARAALSGAPSATLSIHAGVHWGEVKLLDGNAFGEPVYTAARLASLAKPGELLMGAPSFEQMSQVLLSQLKPLGAIRLKGKDTPLDIRSYVHGASIQQTEMEPVVSNETTQYAMGVELSYKETVVKIENGKSLIAGRSIDCDIVVPVAWVSRRHATVSLNQGIVEFSDHSSTGSFLMQDDGRELKISRRTVALVGSGEISLGTPRGTILRFSILRSEEELAEPTRPNGSALPGVSVTKG